MKELIIIGAGGMGRSMYSIAENSIGYDNDFIIKGFLDDNLSALNPFEGYPPVISTIKEYQINEDDVFICSIGNMDIKKQICNFFKKKGGVFYTLISKKAILRNNARIGQGTVIADFAHIGADSVIGENCLIQTFAVIGHDCKIGNYVRLDTHCTCVGGVIIKDEVIVYTSAILNHDVIVEEKAKVAAGSFVIRKVKNGVTVFGSPAKILR
jgi:sugar O-acyltransferase (sialic acid O-acetyltransferase NeuD family)